MKRAIYNLLVPFLFITNVAVASDIQPANGQDTIVVSPYDASRDHDEIVDLFEQERRWLGLGSPKGILLRAANIKDYRKIALARFDNHFAGFIVYCIIRREGYIDYCAVKSEFRSKGCCAQLLNYACNELKKSGAQTVEISTTDNNTRAQRAYLNAGFTMGDNKMSFAKDL
jgi:ribosomal protein S18 acetylase RimI-like enzyme